MDLVGGAAVLQFNFFSLLASRVVNAIKVEVWCIFPAHNLILYHNQWKMLYTSADQEIRIS